VTLVEAAQGSPGDAHDLLLGQGFAQPFGQTHRGPLKAGRILSGRPAEFEQVAAADPPVPAGIEPLRCSPLTRARDWQGAQLVAEAMTGAAAIEADAAH
jgi:hypothetical protein